MIWWSRIVRFTLYPNDDVLPFNQVQRCVVESCGSIGRHKTPKLNRLLIGVYGEGILRIDDVEIALQPNVVQAISNEQSVEIINASPDTELSFWIIQAHSR